MRQPTLSLQPIFIVGLPRSGTTLLAVMLAGHSRLSCGPETHFFSTLTARVEKTLRSAKDWPVAAVDYLFSLNDWNPVPLNYGFTRDELLAHLWAADKSVATVAAALPELFRKRHGKLRWMEKTPDHIMHVDKIRAHFPDAPIIRIRRDPRDVALSLVKVSWGPDTFLDALTYCHKCLSTSEAFFCVDANSHTVSYEALVASPERELRHICEFLHEQFEPSMLDTKQAAAHVNRTNEPWKSKVGEGVDKSRANAWTNILTAEQQQEAAAIIGGYTDERYSVAGNRPLYIEVAGFATTADQRGLAFLGQIVQTAPVRFWPVNADERPIGTLFIGDPGSGDWLGWGSKWERLLAALALAGTIAKYRMTGHPYSWPWVAEADWNRFGYCAKLIAVALGRKKDRLAEIIPRDASRRHG